MALRTYTLHEMADTISRSGKASDINRLMRQIQHWTTSDLLHPQEGKYSGTGRHRRYDVDEVRRAAIFYELGRYRVPVPTLETFAIVMHQQTELNQVLWDRAINGDGTIYLFFGWDDDVIDFQIVDDLAGASSAKSRRKNSLMSIKTSAIVMDLTQIFRQINF